MTGLTTGTAEPATQMPMPSGEAFGWLKFIGGMVIALAITSFGSYWWGRLDEAVEQKAKVAGLQRIVVEKQIPVIKKVYEDRIVYQDRIETIEVPKIIEKKVYQNVCLDDEGVDAFNKMMKP